MGQLDTQLPVLSRPGQPTRGLESYVGKTSRNPDHRFSIHDYDSSYLQERTRREALYNSLPFDDLYIKIKNSFTQQAFKEIVDLNSLLSTYVILLEPSALNPLNQPQTQKISTLFDFFKSSLQKKIAILEKEWRERERKIISPSLPPPCRTEEIAQLDYLTREYLLGAAPSWLEGQFRISGNKSILDYGTLIQAINHFEEIFWQPYLQKYQSAIFEGLKAAEEEKNYLHHHYQEQFAFSTGQVQLYRFRLQASLPHWLLQEMNYLQDHLAFCNEIKIFMQTKLQSLDEDRRRLSVNGNSLDSFTEMKSKYPSLSQKFPDFGRQLLYFGSLVSTYEQQRDSFQDLLREQELSLEQQITAERKSRNKLFSHPLIISLEPFDISTYLQRQAPSTTEMQKIQKLLLGDDSWERKMEKLPSLLDRNPSYSSERDKEFLYSLIFALKTSRTEGMLEHLCREKPELNQKIKEVLSQLQNYVQQYASRS